MAEQESRERGILAISYTAGTIPTEPTESGVRIVSRGPDTRTWDVQPPTPVPTVPVAIAAPSTVAELLGKINPTLLAPQPTPMYPYSQPESSQFLQPYAYNGYSEPQLQAPPQSGWGPPVPYPEDRPAWGGQNNYQRNFDRAEYDLGHEDRGGGDRGGNLSFKRNIKPGGRFKSQVCRFWLKNE